MKIDFCAFKWSNNLLELSQLLQHPCIIWSAILPRLLWRCSCNTVAMTRCRLRTKRFYFICITTGRERISQSAFKDRNPSLLRDGNDSFLYPNDCLALYMSCGVPIGIGHDNVEYLGGLSVYWICVVGRLIGSSVAVTFIKYDMYRNMLIFVVLVSLQQQNRIYMYRRCNWYRTVEHQTIDLN